MSANVARALKPVDALEVQVMVENVTDSLSTVPKDVTNVLKDACDVCGDVPLWGVMGGFHLSGQQIEEIIPDTVKDMQSFGLKRIIPAHCTGWRAVHALANIYGDDVLVP